MDRRLLLLSLAAVGAVPAAALAQSSAPAVQADSLQMGEAEMRHVRDTLAAGTVSLETSRIALDKARNRDLKQFAMFERDEQTGIAEVLHTLVEPTATASTGSARTSGGQPDIPADKRQMIDKLRAMQAGAEFDRMYHQIQVEGHNELLRIQQAYLNAGRNVLNRAVAMLASGHIKEHITELKTMELGRG